MFLFQKRFHQGLKDGSVTLSFRQWPKARVKPKGRYRVHPIGVVEVDAISRTTLGQISSADAKLAGFADTSELVAYVGQVAVVAPSDDLAMFRIELHYGGDGDRVEHALDDMLTDEDVVVLEEKLARIDGGAAGPWTRKVLKLIQKRPRIAASQLATSLGLETLPFKTGVRKLKKLGLTQSFEVGYEVSPRGVAFLKRSPKAKPAQRRKR